MTVRGGGAWRSHARWPRPRCPPVLARCLAAAGDPGQQALKDQPIQQVAGDSAVEAELHLARWQLTPGTRPATGAAEVDLACGLGARPGARGHDGHWGSPR